MCRLFGMTSGSRRTKATFWLLEAPDSLAVQSRRYPDGFGIGTFEPDGIPNVEKRPAAAYEDDLFARAAKEEESTTFLAHLRYAITGDLSYDNTHPFEQKGRLFAHNGVVRDLPRLDERLGSYRGLVRGETDSERLFALITKEIDEHDGDVEAGIRAAVSWVAEELPIFSINFVLTSPTGLWALRYPHNRELFLLERGAGGTSGQRHLDAASGAGTVRVRSGELAEHPVVIVASEPMDEDPGWTLLEPGELIHVSADLDVTRNLVLPDPPKTLLHTEDFVDYLELKGGRR